jgi:DNA-binding MarR family transcriptional regulator
VTKANAATAYPLGEPLEFLQRLWRLEQALERLSSRMLKRLGITAQQRLVLRCVGKYPGITPGQLAALLHVDPGTVSAALRRLEARRLLERRRDEVDSRRVTLGLTRAGRALDAPTEGTVEEAVTELLATTPPADLAAATAVLERLATLVNDKAGV